MEIREIIFLLFDVFWKLVKSGIVINGTVELRNPESVVAVLGIILLVGVLLYAIPKTLFIGALLLVFMFILDGAIATIVHIEHLNLSMPYSRFALGYDEGVLKKVETTKTGDFYKINYQLSIHF
ncbi:DoxX family protein [Pedobacter immunditicola]|uniref:DoxX family protein n=1 Tax=Pedobacter immunditicola TaxID=3133440 RepID=UPI0030A02DB6